MVAVAASDAAQTRECLGHQFVPLLLSMIVILAALATECLALFERRLTTASNLVSD